MRNVLYEHLKLRFGGSWLLRRLRVQKVENVVSDVRDGWCRFINIALCDFLKYLLHCAGWLVAKTLKSFKIHGVFSITDAVTELSYGKLKFETSWLVRHFHHQKLIEHCKKRVPDLGHLTLVKVFGESLSNRILTIIGLWFLLVNFR